MGARGPPLDFLNSLSAGGRCCQGKDQNHRCHDKAESREDGGDDAADAPRHDGAALRQWVAHLIQCRQGPVAHDPGRHAQPAADHAPRKAQQAQEQHDQAGNAQGQNLSVALTGGAL